MALINSTEFAELAGIEEVKAQKMFGALMKVIPIIQKTVKTKRGNKWGTYTGIASRNYLHIADAIEFYSRHDHRFTIQKARAKNRAIFERALENYNKRKKDD